MTQGCAIQWAVDSNVILNARAHFTFRLETFSLPGRNAFKISDGFRMILIVLLGNCIVITTRVLCFIYIQMKI